MLSFPPAARGLPVRPALPERASARPVLQRRRPGELRPPDGRGGEDSNGRVRRR